MEKADGHNEQWKTVKLGEYALIVRGGSPRPIDSYITSDENGINWIKIGDIDVNGKYVEKTSEKIIPEGKLYSREVHKGDFILSNSMSFGRPYILKIDGCIHDGWLAIQNYEQTFDTNFLFYVLSSDLVKKQYLSMASGSTVLNLNKEKVAQIEISYPDSLPAQRRIAAILSAADKVIEQTRQLIGKYKSIKQGMMEDLLKPKEGWKKVKLGECLTIGNGQDYKHLQSGDIPVYGTGGVMTYVDDYLYEGETVCIGRKGTINKPVYYSGKIWTVDTLFYSHSFVGVMPLFIYYVFCNIDWNKYNEATGVPSLSKETIYKIEISVPDLPKQRRIAKILSGIDKKIEAEEKVLEKYEKIKKGLMERLLKE